MQISRSLILVLIVLHAAAAATCVIPDLAQALNHKSTAQHPTPRDQVAADDVKLNRKAVEPVVIKL